jgi:hypothetical protein
MEHWISSNLGDPILVGWVATIAICIATVIGAAIYDRRASIKKYLEHRRDVRIQRGLLMGKKKRSERQAFVKGVLADAITNGIEEAWFAGKITREEANDCYRMIGKTHHIPDLIPVMTAAQAKSAIKGRRSRGVNTPAQERPSWGESPATKIDDKAPAPGPNVIDASKAFGAKALARLKTA